MANESYAQGSVSVGTTATKVCTVPNENDDVMVQTGSVAVTFGGPVSDGYGRHSRVLRAGHHDHATSFSGWHCA